MIEVRSLHRTVKLDLGPDGDDGWQRWLLVPVGSTDAQVLAWAADGWPPRIVAALRAALAVDNPDLAELALRQGYRAHVLDRLAAEVDAYREQLASGAGAPEPNPADPFIVGEPPSRPITNSGP